MCISGYFTQRCFRSKHVSVFYRLFIRSSRRKNSKCFFFSILRYIQVMDSFRKTKNLPNVWWVYDDRHLLRFGKAGWWGGPCRWADDAFQNVRGLSKLSVLFVNSEELLFCNAGLDLKNFSYKNGKTMTLHLMMSSLLCIAWFLSCKNLRMWSVSMWGSLVVLTYPPNVACEVTGYFNL